VNADNVMKKKWLPLLFVAVLALPLIISNQYFLRLVNIGMVFAILAISLNFVLGYAGQISLGHAGFFGIGAYTAAILTHGGSGYLFWPALVAAGMVGALAGAIIGIPALRLKGHYLAFATLAMGEIIRIVLYNYHWLTNGTDGIGGIPAPAIPGFVFDSDRKYFYLLLVCVCISIAIAHRTQHSKLGRTFVAVRDADIAAGTSGINVTRVKINAFIASSVLAAVAGALYAHLVGFISPDTFSFDVTAQVLSMVLIGGIGSTLGPVIGAFLIILLPEAFRVSHEFYQVAYGIGLAACLVFMPRGIMGLVNRKASCDAQIDTGDSNVNLATKNVLSDSLCVTNDDRSSNWILTIENLTCRFGGIVAIDNLNMKVARGSVHALIGPNGAGKSTFINLVSGVYRVNYGSLIFNGTQLSGLKPWQISSHGVARTYQNLRSFHSLSVMNNVMVGSKAIHPVGWLSVLLGRNASAIEESHIHATAREALEFVGLWDKRDTQVSSLPHEQQRLVEIARALAARPQMILLDEPAAGMNPTEVERLLVCIKRMKDAGMTVLLVEHNIPFVNRVADEITVISFGKKITDGQPATVLNHPEVVSAYLGTRVRKGGSQIAAA
jgi:branched-chain amino acid transport system permease protein